MNDTNKNTTFGIRPSARGLTLVELMVASSIIVVLILSVGTVLSGLGLLVGVSQSAIRINAKVAAISSILHQDTRRAGQCGFICIAQAADGSPQLFVLAIGPTASTTGGATDLTGTGVLNGPSMGGRGDFSTTGTGGLACLGQCDNTGMGSILWHTTWVINTSASQGSDCNLSDSATPPVALTGVGNGAGQTKYLRDPREYQCLSRWDSNCVVSAFQVTKAPLVPTTIYPLPATGTGPSNSAPINLPPGYNAANIANTANALNDLNNMWKILSVYGSELSITWTDGTTDSTGTLQWYGIYYNPGAAYGAIPAGWYAYTKGPILDLATTPCPYGWATLPTEYAVSGKYRALFCHNDSVNAWPTAIKIRFNLSDPSAPKEFDTGNTASYAAYNQATSHAVGEIVQYNGRSYRCILANGAASPQAPTNSTYWCLTGMYYEVICPISQ